MYAYLFILRRGYMCVSRREKQVVNLHLFFVLSKVKRSTDIMCIKRADINSIFRTSIFLLFRYIFSVSRKFTNYQERIDDNT